MEIEHKGGKHSNLASQEDMGRARSDLLPEPQGLLGGPRPKVCWHARPYVRWRDEVPKEDLLG